MMLQNSRTGERGNIFLMVIIGIVLFSALMFTLSRGMNESPSNVSGKQARLTAADMISYTQQVSRAVDRLRRAGISESDISFKHDDLPGHDNTACTDDACMVFKKDGGGVDYKTAPPGWPGFIHWTFNGHNQVEGVGEDCANASCAELMMIQHGLTRELCVEINDRLGVENPSGIPPAEPNIATGAATRYTGSFDSGGGEVLGDDAAELAGAGAACLNEGGSADYYFYAVLIAR
jgi:hypothetical protein